MTQSITADPSLLAQLRQLLEECASEARKWNGLDPINRRVARQLEKVAAKLTAILEAQPPETPLAEELVRLRAENDRLRVPPPGWHRMAVVRATAPGEPLDPGYYVWTRAPGPAPKTAPTLQYSADEACQMAEGVFHHWRVKVRSPGFTHDEGVQFIKMLHEAFAFFSAPTPDPPAETPTPLVVDPPVDDPEYRAAWNAGYTEAIEDFKSQREAERPADTPTLVNEAVEAVADGTADFSWMPPAETPPRKLSDDAFGLSEHLIVTPKPRPADTEPTALHVPGAKPSHWCENPMPAPGTHGWCANRTPRETHCTCPCHHLAETPTGLAPLRTMSEDDLAPRYVSGIDPEQYLAVCVELDAQRQASASARREWFKAGFLATVNPTKPGGWSFDGPAAADREPEAFAAWERSLVDPASVQPCVSPRPPSGTQ